MEDIDCDDYYENEDDYECYKPKRRKHTSSASTASTAQKKTAPDEGVINIETRMAELQAPCPVHLQFNRHGVGYWQGILGGTRVKFQGVTRFLSKHVFNHVEECYYTTNRSGARDLSAIANHQTNEAADLVGDSDVSALNYSEVRAGCKAVGRDHGIIVHQELGELCQQISFGLIGSHAANQKIYETSRKTFDDCSVRLYEYCKSFGWYLVASEKVVYDLGTKMATAIDFLFYRNTTREQPSLIAIELKTGTHPIMELMSPGAKLRGPLSDFDDTPYNQYTAQLMITIMLEEMRLGQDKSKWKFVNESYIIHINPRTKDITRLPPAEWAYDSKVRKRVYDFMQEQSHRKKAVLDAQIAYVTETKKASKKSKTAKTATLHNKPLSKTTASTTAKAGIHEYDESEDEGEERVEEW